MTDWLPDLTRSSSPRYIAIADLIEMDLRDGTLAAGDRLPPQRELARRLSIDFTTVARGYVEARKRGLVDTQVGRGTFVTGRTSHKKRHFETGTFDSDPRRTAAADLSMNLPPEPEDPGLLERMRAGLGAVAADLVPLLRYQEFGGAEMDKEAAALWLARRGISAPTERIFIAPGAHPALLAIVGTLAKPGETILSEKITYPGIRSIAAQLRLQIAGLPMDKQGILPDALEAACRDRAPKALYLNPTLQNPTTLTMSSERRAAICAIVDRFGIPIVEDDAYGFVSPDAPAPLADFAPDLTWHIAGLSKCIGAGLRLAYVLAPATKAPWPFIAAMRASNVMASPLNIALLTRWIEDGTADDLLQFVRTEAAHRQEVAASLLSAETYSAAPQSFNIWLTLRNGWNLSNFTAHMRSSGISVVASDAFTVEGPAPETVRVCLGGPIGRDRLAGALGFMAHSLAGPPEMTGSFF
ncbi:PLP-dependent aminotransferase family protein [Mycoplana rhizolycopersici]|uniref:PLP-dependent aminotransferase family protein n=1 Tax=Mycoplana rhizolycopersici TaxID=2746702 RepID=A0ABX2QBN4_9HYPH|nr:PLP-dependent aminotransferase family protein [Rhizobium rhizolycopersici]NVP55162.1 PLP-dependent aminotransferase family protein [Rhizobium rhizolycopersici]